uniref:transcriptional corepressor SEUSS n=1 Tax=Erigeron canadensis TaxID=72917 RepID=UPI001CB9B46D|nr:transcriptional corepressor SEUSS [Erigeron canadensis]
MVPQGPPTPLGGTHSIPSSLLRSNSGLIGSQGGGSMSSQSGFASLVSPRTQFNTTNMIGNVPNVANLIHQSYGNGGQSSGISGQRDVNDAGGESDPLSLIRKGMGCNVPSSSFNSSNMVNPNVSGHISAQQFSSGNQMLSDQQSAQQLESQNFQQSLQNNHQQQQQQQQQYQNIRGGLGGVGQVKVEPQTTNYQQALMNLGPVKMEPQHSQSLSNLPPVKLEPQHSDQSLFLQQQQQQQQQFLNVSRQSPQAAAAAQINLLQQQRLLQIHQQQQLLKNIPQQRPAMHPQFQQQNMALRSPAKPVYEPGMCARRLTHYMYQQQHRPEDNNIEFWRKFVAEYFAPNAKKKWCVSLYGSGRHTTGVFPQDVWHCEICNKKPGRGFEANAEVLPRLFKIKYESGTLEELLYVDMPREYQNSSGQIVLDYAKAIQESVFEQLRVVRDGQLRIVFTPDLKICSWEFCARHHEELIPRRLLIPQISQLGNAAQKYQASTNNASSNQYVPDLQSNCNMFVASARQLAKALEVPLVNDLGYTKRYVRCLQISEVVNSMKDLIDYSRERSIGPMESLAKFPRRTSTTSGLHSQSQPSNLQQQSPQPQQQQQQQQQQEQQQNSNGVSTVNNSNPLPVTSSNGTIAGLLHQSSMNSRHQQSSINIPQTLQNGPLANMHSVNSPNISTQSGDADPQSSVQKILHEMMSSSQLGGSGGDMKNVGNSGYLRNGQSGMISGIQAAMSHNSLSMNGRVAMNHHHQQQQQDLGNQLLNGVGAANGFNNLPFDWKTSP